MTEAKIFGRVDRVGATRLAVGLVQGLLLYALIKAGEHKAWPATDRTLLFTLTLIAGYVPLTLLAGAGAMRRTSVAVWSTAVAAGLATFAVHAITRGGVVPAGQGPFAGDFGSSAPLVGLFGAVWAFVLWHLVQSADQTRTLVAPYRAYFDTAWQHAVQLALAGLFTGAFWIVLGLGGLLFNLIGISAVGDLITKDWFAVPVTPLVFAAAVQLTDANAGLTRGARTLALALLSWLTPILGGLTIAFLCALPFTGLKPLFTVGSATGVLLGAGAALIVFLNAAYHDGETPPPAVLRWSGRAVAVALVPLLAVAAWGLALRVGQYGWTPSRVVVAAGLLVGGVYALGYAAAALTPRGPWLKGLEATNVLNAVVVLLVLTALFTPLADPARIATASQVARLESGQVAPSKFDWDFLSFRAERYGRDALARLAKSPDAAIAAAARAALAKPLPTVEVAGAVAPSAQDRAKAIKVYPAGRVLPQTLLGQDFADAFVPCLTTTADGCEAYLVDLNRDGRDEVLVRSDQEMTLLAEGAKGWTLVGRYGGLCEADDAALRKGTLAPVAGPWPDISVRGRRLDLSEEAPESCPAGATASRGGR